MGDLMRMYKWRSLTALWMLLACFLMVWLLSFSQLYQRVDAWLADAQQALLTREAHFSDVLVIDIDDASLEQLKPYLGSWPYRRDAYALMLDYLNDMGVRAVVIDILLAEPREKDDVLAASLRRNHNATLVASTPNSDRPMTDDEKTQMRAFSWQTPPELPAHAWSAALLPGPVLTTGLSSVVQLGMVPLEVDNDGVLRSLPLMHDVQGIRLPSVALATLAQNGARVLEYDAARQRAVWGGASWPVDARGHVHLAFPKNANAMLTMPFRQVMEAALGVVQLEDAASFFKGKTVFIGSSAQLSDRVTTPRGVMSGTAVLALAYQSLQSQLLLIPQRGSWNALLIGLALLPLLVSMHFFRHKPLYTAMTMGGGLVLVTGVSLLLLFNQQQSVLLFALLLLSGGWLMLIVQQQTRLHFHNAHLLAQARALKQTNLELKITASTDTLTGLLVRRAFLERCHEEIERSQRQGRPLSLGIVDLDHFKRVNDTYGHATGDLVLTRFADILRRDLRTIDVPGRWGGEEFVVLMPETSLTEAQIVLDRVRVVMSEQIFPPPAHDLNVTMSAGLAEFDGTNFDPEHIVAQADKALYEAKHSGRNRICSIRGGEVSGRSG